MYRVLGRRRDIAMRNLAICFPEMSPEEQLALAHRHFESLGMGVIEIGMTWWCRESEIKKLVTGEGVEHLEEALERGNGVFMLTGHFSSPEIATRGLVPFIPPLSAMFRPSNNPLIDQVLRRARGVSAPNLLKPDSIRTLIRTLRSNLPVWYAADQAYNRRGTVLVPFFWRTSNDHDISFSDCESQWSRGSSIFSNSSGPWPRIPL